MDILAKTKLYPNAIRSSSYLNRVRMLDSNGKAALENDASLKLRAKNLLFYTQSNPDEVESLLSKMMDEEDAGKAKLIYEQYNKRVIKAGEFFDEALQHKDTANYEQVLAQKLNEFRGPSLKNATVSQPTVPKTTVAQTGSRRKK